MALSRRYRPPRLSSSLQFCVVPTRIRQILLLVNRQILPDIRGAQRGINAAAMRRFILLWQTS